MTQEQFEQTVTQELHEIEASKTIGFGEIWQTLSAIDVSEQIEVKGNGNFQLKYLSWAWAWGVLMAKYPDAAYHFENPVYGSDNTCEIWVSVTINGHSRKMWLPVMDHKNKAIVNPDMRAISDTRMRCLVKCLAMFGLGHYIYAGEDIPKDITPSISKVSDANVVLVEKLGNESGADMAAMLKFYGVNSISELNVASAEDAIAKLRNKIKTQEAGE